MGRSPERLSCVIEAPSGELNEPAPLFIVQLGRLAHCQGEPS